jgi:hypothetical protein
MPQPADPLDLLAKQFSDAARLEIKQDSQTGNPYRVNHAVPNRAATGQLSFFWIDIDDPKTTPTNMRASLVMRREQMVDDGLQLTFDLEHWNSTRPEGAQIEPLPMDLTLDLEIRRASREGDDEAA